MGKHTGTESIRFRGCRYAGGMAVILQRVMFLWREKRHRIMECRICHTGEAGSEDV